jgi:alpha-D-ribose 1-methylphosphonate 5-triphosphate diphosphatase
MDTAVRQQRFGFMSVPRRFGEGTATVTLPAVVIALSCCGRTRSRLGMEGAAMRIDGGMVLVGDRFERTDVLVDGSVIAGVGEGTAAPGPAIDARGLMVLPGLVDIHGDAFERQLMPRPGVAFPIDMALRDTDRQLVANGITTAFHGVTWSWEPGLRGPESARALVDAIASMRPDLAADTRVHLRHETFNLDAEAEIIDWLHAGRIDCIAFNDHMEGTLKARSRPDKVGKMIERSGLSAEAFLDLVEAVHARRDEVPGSITRMAKAAVDAGVPALSHDDMDPAMRGWFRELGVVIAEFPVTEAVAADAAGAGEPIVFGAPNVIRGGSHTGCPSAAEMVGAGLCTVLASDYYYPALAAAPFRLAGDGIVDLAAAWRLVSAGPAEALGLADRGSIAEGLRADMVVVEPPPPGGAARIVATVAGGRLVHLAEGARLG